MKATLPKQKQKLSSLFYLQSLAWESSRLLLHLKKKIKDTQSELLQQDAFVSLLSRPCENWYDLLWEGTCGSTILSIAAATDEKSTTGRSTSSDTILLRKVSKSSRLS